MTQQTITAERMRADIADALFLDSSEVTDDADLLDLGLDSVRMMSLVDRWRAAGVEVSFAELAQSPTLPAWIALVVTPCSR